jgi:hypothetical protein
MRTMMLGLILIALILNQAGCATGFRAGGTNGVSAGAAIRPVPAPVYVPPSDSLPPPPPAPPSFPSAPEGNRPLR